MGETVGDTQLHHASTQGTGSPTGAAANVLRNEMKKQGQFTWNALQHIDSSVSRASFMACCCEAWKRCPFYAKETLPSALCVSCSAVHINVTNPTSQKLMNDNLQIQQRCSKRAQKNNSRKFDASRLLVFLRLGA